MIKIKTLKKYNDVPGKCTKVEIESVKDFFNTYIEIRDIYKEVFGHDPMGLTLESQLDHLEYYDNKGTISL